MKITSERLAFWFFRLNGFLTISNFVVHADEGYGQKTEIDVLGVRFPHRSENHIRPMPDHPLFTDNARLQVVLVETKRTQCALNTSWIEPARGNLERVLRAGGFVAAGDVPTVANGLYEAGDWSNNSIHVSLVAAGGKHNSGLKRDFPLVRQLFWDEHTLPFIHERFWNYRDEKRMHAQWDEGARELFRAVLITDGELEAFKSMVEIQGE